MPNEAHDRKADFLLEEYRFLKQETFNLHEAGTRNERLAFGALIVLYGLIFSDGLNLVSGLRLWIWFLPPLVAIVHLRRSFLYTRAVHRIGQYIKEETEPHFLADGRGWQHRRYNRAWDAMSKDSFVRGTSRLWVLILVATLAAAAFSYHTQTLQ